MPEIELIAEKISEQDNTINVEMSNDEIWFLKYFIKKYHPKKIVEIGISAGGNTVNLLKWKDDDAQLFSIDIATQWYQDNTKLSGWMADELDVKDNWKLYRGFDYLDVYKEIGKDIDFIIIDTVHFMPGEFLTFIAALPQLKDDCIVVLHDIHLNMVRISGNKFRDYDLMAHCTGLLFGGVSSQKKWTLKSDNISNIGAFIVDNYTRDNIKDVFHILCSAWHYFPSDLNLLDYSKYIYENYSVECNNLFYNCLKLQSYCFNHDLEVISEISQTARVDIINKGEINNEIFILDAPSFINIGFPDWFKTEAGKGAVIHTKERKFDLKIKCINEGKLEIALRGPDIRDESDKRVPGYVNFNMFRINHENIFNDKITIWHDDPYIFEKTVNDGEIIELHFEWSPYKTFI